MGPLQARLRDLRSRGVRVSLPFALSLAALIAGCIVYLLSGWGAETLSPGSPKPGDRGQRLQDVRSSASTLPTLGVKGGIAQRAKGGDRRGPVTAPLADGTGDLEATGAGLEKIQLQEATKPADKILFDVVLARSTQGDNAAAMKEFYKFAAEQPRNPLWHLGMGIVASRSLQRATAEKHLAKAFDLAGQDPVRDAFVKRWVGYWRAVNLSGVKTRDEAIRRFLEMSRSGEIDVSVAAAEALRGMGYKGR